jgi:glycosyltransferase involved in cell wall biosynthesis
VGSVLHIITGLGDGGAESVLCRLCSHDLGTRHFVVSLGGAGKYGPLLVDAGVPVTCLDMPRGRVTLGGLLSLWRTVRQHRPDAVQTWMYHANLLGGIVAYTAGRRNICWGIRQSGLRAGAVSRRTRLVDWLSARLSRWLPRRIVCCAESALLAHAEAGYDRARMVVIPNGYNLSGFRPDPPARAALRNELGLAQSEPVSGFVARFHPFKDHANLLRALALLRKSAVAPTCLLVGTGMDHENAELAEIIGRLGLSEQVRLLGARSDIPAVMNALDVHVMSSENEGFPNVLAEAMACGTPCVSTDVGDAAQILGGTGRLVPPRDPAALAEAIGQMLGERADAGWTMRQGAARRHILENFSMERMLASYHRTWSLDGLPIEDLKHTLETPSGVRSAVS